MIYRELGLSGMQMSAVGMGTWAIGGLWWGGADETESIAALRAGLDNGINLIDTAPAYGFGLAEEIVGKAVKGYDRSKVILATKCGLAWHVNEGDFFFEMGGETVYRNLRPATIRYEVEQSLRRLDTDYLDLYQTHWQDKTTPIADSMAELLKLKEEGKIRAIGVSNASIEQMREYLAVGHIDSNQPLFNMLERAIEEEVLPFCRQNNISVLSYSSLALGLLTGKVSPDRKFAEGDQRANYPRFQPANLARVNAVCEKFAPFRQKYGLDQTQLVIAWTISRPGVTTALVGVRNAQQAMEVAAGGATVISPEDLVAIEAIIAELK